MSAFEELRKLEKRVLSEERPRNVTALKAGAKAKYASELKTAVEKKVKDLGIKGMKWKDPPGTDKDDPSACVITIAAVPGDKFGGKTEDLGSRLRGWIGNEFDLSAEREGPTTGPYTIVVHSFDND